MGVRSAETTTTSSEPVLGIGSSAPPADAASAPIVLCQPDRFKPSVVPAGDQIIAVRPLVLCSDNSLQCPSSIWHRKSRNGEIIMAKKKTPKDKKPAVKVKSHVKAGTQQPFHAAS